MSIDILNPLSLIRDFLVRCFGLLQVIEINGIPYVSIILAFFFIFTVIRLFLSNLFGSAASGSDSVRAVKGAYSRHKSHDSNSNKK